MSTYFLWEFLSSFLTLVDREWSFWKIVLKSCSWNNSSRTPSNMTIPILLLSTGCWKEKQIICQLSWKVKQRYKTLLNVPPIIWCALPTCSISKIMRSPDLVVSEPINLLKSSEKLENRAALAATRVLILVFSSRGSRSAAGYPKDDRKVESLKRRM